MTDMPRIPRLDYHDKAVCDLLYADDDIHDPFAICDYLADHTDIDIAARQYADDHMAGELVVDAPDLAWSFVGDVRADDPVLYDRADDRIAEDVVPVEALESLDAHMCYVAGIIVTLKAEDEIYRAVDLLNAAVADGRLAETT